MHWRGRFPSARTPLFLFRRRLLLDRKFSGSVVIGFQGDHAFGHGIKNPVLPFVLSGVNDISEHIVMLDAGQGKLLAVGRIDVAVLGEIEL